MSDRPAARTALVTGASSGIGAAIAGRMLADGHSVIGVSRRAPPADLAGRPRFFAESLDLEAADVSEGLESLARRHRDVDVVVACAGRGQFGSLEEFSYAQIAALIQLDLTAQLLLVRAFVPQLKRGGRGDIILIGSEAAYRGGRRGAVYSAAKAGLRGFSRALREECARSGVRVCSINPGMVRTPFFDRLDFEPGADEADYLLPSDVAAAVALAVDARSTAVFDEIDLTPLKRVVRKKR